VTLGVFFYFYFVKVLIIPTLLVRLTIFFISLFISSWCYAQIDITVYKKNGDVLEFNNIEYENRGNNSYITEENGKISLFSNSRLDSIIGLLEGDLYFATEEPNPSNFFKISASDPRLIGQSITFNHNNMSSQEGYDIVKKWINFTFNNPSSVIKSDLQNEYIRITGSTDVCWAFPGYFGAIKCTDQYHTLAFGFKNDEITFKIIQLEMIWLPGKITSSGRQNYDPTYGDMQASNSKKRKDQRDAANWTLKYLNNYAFEIRNLIERSMIMTSDKALSELKKQKDMLNLEIISQAEYDSIKAVLIKYIK